MGPIFEGDGWFCVIAIIVSELLADIPWLSDQLRLPVIVMISLIFALFYGPEPKRISKKNFRGRSSGAYGRFAAWRAGREFYWKRYLNRSVGNADLNKKICGHMKKAPSHEDAFISFPYLVKGGLSSLNETGS